MRYKRFVLIIFLILVPGLNIALGQYLHVMEITGDQSDHTISSISKMHFTPDGLSISYTDNTVEEFSFSDIRYLSFSDSTIVKTEERIESAIKLFPNPLSYELNVDLSKASGRDWTLNILDLNGKTLKTVQISDAETITVDMSFLPSGSYICNFRNEKESRSFIVVKR